MLLLHGIEPGQCSVCTEVTEIIQQERLALCQAAACQFYPGFSFASQFNGSTDAGIDTIREMQYAALIIETIQ
jgi:hypothetical protein